MRGGAGEERPGAVAEPIHVWLFLLSIPASPTPLLPARRRAYNSLVDSIRALGMNGAHRGHLRSLSKSKVKRGAKGEERARESLIAQNNSHHQQQQQAPPAAAGRGPGGGQAAAAVAARGGVAAAGQGSSGGVSGASTVASSTSYGMLSAREVQAAQHRGSLQALQFMERLRSAMRPAQAARDTIEDDEDEEEEDDDGWQQHP